MDATEKYIGFGETAERIQGRQVLIEDGEKHILQKIPIATPSQNTAIEKKVLAINGNNLVGKVTQTWKGESKELFLTLLHDIKKEKQEDVVKQFLTDGNNNYQVTNLKILNLNDYNADLQIEYDLLFKDAVTVFDKEIYIDIDNRKEFSQFKFDTASRKLPYQFSFKRHIVQETQIQLPQGAKVGSLPSSFSVEQPQYTFHGAWKVEKNQINYRKEIALKSIELSPRNFAAWNNDIAKLENFYNNQLTITQ